MEVGAVKQAFNNEVIHLKKPLNQARIQIIHKLTRKAKTLVEKKAPENLKEKLKRKAEYAVKEVLIIKKIKPKDLAQFIVTHKGELQSHLNKPDVDLDKACARLLLHKSLQGKYSIIRDRYSNVPIKDLFMSRLDRRKLKKEQKEMQKNKKKEKEARKRNNSAGDWKVEDVDKVMKIQDSSKIIDRKVKTLSKDKEDQSSDDENESQSDEKDDISDDNNDSDVKQVANDQASDEESYDSEVESKVIPDDVASQDSDDDDIGQKIGDIEDSEKSDEGSDEDKPTNLTGMLVKTPEENVKTPKNNKISSITNHKPAPTKILKEDNRKKIPKQTKESNKNRKLSDKIHTKKFKEIETPVTNKVVDPFFITSTGENYMSLAEPRAPDEVKEIHKQGNRKIRRAAMFGHEPKLKPRNNFSNNNANFNRQNRYSNSQDFSNNFDRNSRDESDKVNKQNRFSKDSNNSFNNDTKNKHFNKFNNNKDAKKVEEKPEKLHPSWEAKKKLSSVLPFQGKKIVFNDG